MDNQPSSIVRTYIAGIKPFSGEYADLVRFLTEIEDITPTLATLSELEIHIRFKQILGKLEGPAREVLQDNPQSWEQVRNLLVRSFSDHLDLGTQIVRMERIHYTNSIIHTHNLLRTSQTRMLDKITLSSDSDAEKTMLKEMVKRRTFLQFRKSIPQACQGALTNRGCASLLEAIQILQEEDFLNYDKYHEDRRIPYQHVNRSPHSSNHPPNQNHYQPNHNTQRNRNQMNRHNNQNNFPRSNNYNRNSNNNQNRYNNPNNYQRASYSGQTRRSNPQPVEQPMEIDQNFHVEDQETETERKQKEDRAYLLSGCERREWGYP